MKRYQTSAWLFITPFLVVFTVFYIVPVFYAAYTSLFIKKRIALGVTSEVFAGFTNYIRAFQDADFMASIGRMVVFGLVQIPIMVGLACLIALMLDAVKNPLQRFFRVAFYLPYAVPSVIAGLVWGYLYSQNISPFNDILQVFHLPPIDFLSTSNILWSIGNIVTWTWTGYNMLSLYSALQVVPREIYEAARIDGANGWNLIRYIKLPLLRPAIYLSLIFSIIGTMQIFTEPYILRPLAYIPDNITPNTYIYLAASRDVQYSYSAAMALIIAGVTFLLAGLFIRASRLGRD
jgi:multiple sugar transport system permease protein